MPEPMTDERLAELERLSNEATDAPWIAEYSDETGNVVLPPGYESAREYVARTQLYHAMADAEFIAAARTAVPGLVAKLRRGRARHDSRCISLTDSDNNVYCDCRTLAMIDGAKVVRERLSAHVAELEQTVQRVRTALDGLHDEECAARSGTPCDCAVAEVKRALDGGGGA